MKKSFAAIVTVSALMLGGCATSYPVGGILTDITLPAGVTEHAAAKKTGVAKCQSILALVANGDCSIEAAKKDGGITKVSHVDWKANNVLGIIGNYEVRVYGE